MKLKPKKKLLIPTFMILTTTSVMAGAKSSTPYLPPSQDVLSQESYLLAACNITCASTCGLTNKC